jgi:tRNA-binding protein
MSEPRARSVVPAHQFFDIDMRVGRVLECEPFPQARQPAYRMVIDFGELGRRRSSAQLTDNYTADELVGSLVIGVVNLPPRQVGPLRSEVLVLGVYQHNGSTVTLLRPDGDCEPGDRVG